MKKDKIIESLKNELTYSLSRFEANEILTTETSNEINQFFDEIKDLEIKEIYEKVNFKYGWLLNYSNEIKRNSDISTIKAILKFFLILTIISIIIGIIIGISMATS